MNRATATAFFIGFFLLVVAICAALLMITEHNTALASAIILY